MNETALESKGEASDNLKLLRFALYLSAFYALLILLLYKLGNQWIDRERAKYFDLG